MLGACRDGEGGEAIIDLVELEYFVEEREEDVEDAASAGGGGGGGGGAWAKARAADKLRAGLSSLEGVVRVRGAFFSGALQASPHLAPARGPSNHAGGGGGGGGAQGGRRQRLSNSPHGPTARRAEEEEGRQQGGRGRRRRRRGWRRRRIGSKSASSPSERSPLSSGDAGEDGGGHVGELGGGMSLGSFSLGAPSSPSMRIEVPIGDGSDELNIFGTGGRAFGGGLAEQATDSSPPSAPSWC